jgi:hypothetical protein
MRIRDHVLIHEVSVGALHDCICSPVLGIPPLLHHTGFSSSKIICAWCLFNFPTTLSSMHMVPSAAKPGFVNHHSSLVLIQNRHMVHGSLRSTRLSNVHSQHDRIARSSRRFALGITIASYLVNLAAQRQAHHIQKLLLLLLQPRWFQSQCTAAKTPGR